MEAIITVPYVWQNLLLNILIFGIITNFIYNGIANGGASQLFKSIGILERRHWLLKYAVFLGFVAAIFFSLLLSGDWDSDIQISSMIFGERFQVHIHHLHLYGLYASWFLNIFCAFNAFDADDHLIKEELKKTHASISFFVVFGITGIIAIVMVSKIFFGLLVPVTFWWVSSALGLITAFVGLMIRQAPHTTIYMRFFMCIFLAIAAGIFLEGFVQSVHDGIISSLIIIK